MFLCEDMTGGLIGACYHEVTNGKLMRNKFGRYLTIIKQSTKNWPSGTSIEGKIIESRIMIPKKQKSLGGSLYECFPNECSNRIRASIY